MPNFTPMVIGEAVLLLGADRSALSAGLLASKVEAEGIFGSIAAVGAAAFIGIGVAAVAGLGYATKSAADLEFAISGAGAIAGATADEMERMRIISIGLSKESQFGAVEIANSMGVLIAAGATTEQVLSGAAKATVTLAQAGGTSMKNAADIVATAMNVWDISGEGTVDVVNRIAGAANKSRFDVAGLSAAIGQGAGAAELARVPFSDFTTYIAATAKFFNSGAEAGNTFKTFLINLNPTSKNAQKELKNLGIITADGANQFFNAAGEVRPLAEVIDVLRDHVGKLEPMDMTKSLKAVFGTRGYRAAAALMNMTSEEFRALDETLRTSSGEDIAAARLDNVQGSAIKLLHTIQALGLELGKGILDKLNLKGSFNDLSSQIPQGAKLFMSGLTGDESQIGGDFGPTLNNFKEAGRIIREEVLPPLHEFYDWIRNNVIPALRDFAVHDVWPKLQWFGGFLSDTLIPKIKEWGLFFKPIVGFLSEHKEVLGGLIAAWLTYTTIMKTVAIVQGLVNLAMMANPFGAVVLGIAALVAIGIVLYKNWDTIKEKFGEVWGWIKQEWDKLPGQLAGAFIAFITGADDLWGLIPAVERALANLVKMAFNKGKELVKGLWNGITQNSDAPPEAIKVLADKSLRAWDEQTDSHSPSKEMYQRGMWLMDGLAEGIKDGSGKSLKAFRDSIDELEEEQRRIRIAKGYAELAGQETKAMDAQLSILAARIAIMKDEMVPLVNQEKFVGDILKQNVADAKKAVDEEERILSQRKDMIYEAWLSGGVAAANAKRQELIVMDQLWEEEIKRSRQWGIELTENSRQVWERQMEMTRKAMEEHQKIMQGILTGNWKAAASSFGVNGVGFMSGSVNIGNGTSVGVGGAAGSAGDAAQAIIDGVLGAGGSLQNAADALNGQTTMGAGVNMTNTFQINGAQDPAMVAQVVASHIEAQMGSEAGQWGMG